MINTPLMSLTKETSDAIGILLCVALVFCAFDRIKFQRPRNKYPTPEAAHDPLLRVLHLPTEAGLRGGWRLGQSSM